MYKDYKRRVDMEINVKNYEETCGGCPMMYDFEDEEGTKYHFRLRNGGASIVCEDTDETLLSDSMPGFDGVCNWEDVIHWAARKGVMLV